MLLTQVVHTVAWAVSQNSSPPCRVPCSEYLLHKNQNIYYTKIALKMLLKLLSTLFPTRGVFVNRHMFILGSFSRDGEILLFSCQYLLRQQLE
jgi:hypothetical protein